MPIYEYQCEECGVRFERMQSMSSAPVSICPECGGRVHRVISSVGVVFKGSGFYVTDNRRSSSGVNRKASKTSADGDVDSSGTVPAAEHKDSAGEAKSEE